VNILREKNNGGEGVLGKNYELSVGREKELGLLLSRRREFGREEGVFGDMKHHHQETTGGGSPRERNRKSGGKGAMVEKRGVLVKTAELPKIPRRKRNNSSENIAWNTAGKK